MRETVATVAELCRQGKRLGMEKTSSRTSAGPEKFEPDNLKDIQRHTLSASAPPTHPHSPSIPIPQRFHIPPVGRLEITHWVISRRRGVLPFVLVRIVDCVASGAWTSILGSGARPMP